MSVVPSIRYLVSTDWPAASIAQAGSMTVTTSPSAPTTAAPPQPHHLLRRGPTGQPDPQVTRPRSQQRSPRSHHPCQPSAQHRPPAIRRPLTHHPSQSPPLPHPQWPTTPTPPRQQQVQRPPTEPAAVSTDPPSRDPLVRRQRRKCVCVCVNPSRAPNDILARPSPGQTLCQRWRNSQAARWSFTRPIDCMKAYTVVGPTKLQPRRFKSFEIAVDSAVLAGI